MREKANAQQWLKFIACGFPQRKSGPKSLFQVLLDCHAEESQQRTLAGTLAAISQKLIK